MFEHPFEAVFVLEYIDVFKGDFTAGKILTGRRRIGSKILTEN